MRGEVGRTGMLTVSDAGVRTPCAGVPVAVAVFERSASAPTVLNRNENRKTSAAKGLHCRSSDFVFARLFNSDFQGLV
jgi:hypothetical protein